MTLIKPIGIDDEVIAAAADAEAYLRETASAYRAMVRNIGTEETDTPARMRDQAHEFRKVVTVAMEEARRVADQLNKSRGIVRDYAIDLAAARLETERLLDRIAALGDATEISG